MVNNKDTADAAMEAAFEIYRKQNAGVGGDYSMRVDFEAGYNAAMNQECVWTPVSERLPDESGFYLTFYKDPEPYRVRYFTKAYGTWSIDRENDDLVDTSNDILAWQPLPKPYQPELRRSRGGQGGTTGGRNDER